MIIIAASGMATGGRVVHHLKAFAPDRRNTILFAGYQAGGTRGAAIAAGSPSVRIHGQDVPVRARGGDAGRPVGARGRRRDPRAGCAHFKAAPKKTFITHGEPAAADALRQRIERELHWPCHLPYYLESVNLD